jgi:hypothetical protein
MLSDTPRKWCSDIWPAEQGFHVSYLNHDQIMTLLCTSSITPCLHFVFIMFIWCCKLCKDYRIPWLLGQYIIELEDTESHTPLSSPNTSLQLMCDSRDVRSPPPNVAAKRVCHAPAKATIGIFVPCTRSSQCDFWSIPFEYCPHLSSQILFC